MITDHLNTRITWAGGEQEHRMQRDKLRTLEKALLYSYQACTAEFSKDRIFRCLINPDKETGNYDNKIISIPYKVKERGEFGINEISTDVHNGEVFRWVETNTYWLIYLEYLEEDAYFRAQIRRCDQIADIDGVPYHVYIRGPVETSIPWNQKAGVEWNDMNHSLELYITKDEKTINFFHRFTKIKIKEEVTQVERMWQVVGCNPYFGDGIIKASLDEYFENTIEEEVQQETKTEEEIKEVVEQIEREESPEPVGRIVGPNTIAPFDAVTYYVTDILGDGTWYIIRNGQEISLNKTDKEISISTKDTSGSFVLLYRTPYDEATIEVHIEAF